MRAALFCLALATSLPAGESLNQALVFHAGFDQGADADFAAGDKRLFTAPGRKRTEPKPGLAEADGIELAPTEGKFGGALAFRRKSKDLVFFKGGPNLGYRDKNWSGSASFWLRLDPDRDLEPGYCDPLQFVAQAWGEGNMFVEFSKDHRPRHFRYAIMAVTRLWNPNNEKWEEMQRRPMVAVEKPPFSREHWTHVCFTFGNANTGAKDGWGRLYLDGIRIGEFNGWENTFNWEVEQSALTLGYSYTGLIDDIAVFNRALTDAEVKSLFELPTGIAGLQR
jgi:hypothetical protein